MTEKETLLAELMYEFGKMIEQNNSISNATQRHDILEIANNLADKLLTELKTGQIEEICDIDLIVEKYIENNI